MDHSVMQYQNNNQICIIRWHIGAISIGLISQLFKNCDNSLDIPKYSNQRYNKKYCILELYFQLITRFDFNYLASFDILGYMHNKKIESHNNNRFPKYTASTISSKLLLNIWHLASNLRNVEDKWLRK